SQSPSRTSIRGMTSSMSRVGYAVVEPDKLSRGSETPVCVAYRPIPSFSGSTFMARPPHDPMAPYTRTLVTSALPYANGPIHIGHLAGAYLPSDLFVRYKRLVGEDIVHICGSDELGVAIMIRARQEGISPREIVDHYHPLI